MSDSSELLSFGCDCYTNYCLGFSQNPNYSLIICIHRNYVCLSEWISIIRFIWVKIKVYFGIKQKHKACWPEQVLLLLMEWLFLHVSVKELQSSKQLMITLTTASTLTHTSKNWTHPLLQIFTLICFSLGDPIVFLMYILIIIGIIIIIRAWYILRWHSWKYNTKQTHVSEHEQTMIHISFKQTVDTSC